MAMNTSHDATTVTNILAESTKLASATSTGATDPIVVTKTTIKPASTTSTGTADLIVTPGADQITKQVSTASPRGAITTATSIATSVTKTTIKPASTISTGTADLVVESGTTAVTKAFVETHPTPVTRRPILIDPIFIPIAVTGVFVLVLILVVLAVLLVVVLRSRRRRRKETAVIEKSPSFVNPMINAFNISFSQLRVMKIIYIFLSLIGCCWSSEYAPLHIKPKHSRADRRAHRRWIFGTGLRGQIRWQKRFGQCTCFGSPCEWQSDGMGAECIQSVESIWSYFFLSNPPLQSRSKSCCRLCVSSGPLPTHFTQSNATSTHHYTPTLPSSSSFPV